MFVGQWAGGASIITVEVIPERESRLGSSAAGVLPFRFGWESENSLAQLVQSIEKSILARDVVPRNPHCGTVIADFISDGGVAAHDCLPLGLGHLGFAKVKIVGDHHCVEGALV